MQIDLVLLNLELLYVFLILFLQRLREKEPDDSFFIGGDLTRVVQVLNTW